MARGAPGPGTPGRGGQAGRPRMRMPAHRTTGCVTRSDRPSRVDGPGRVRLLAVVVVCGFAIVTAGCGRAVVSSPPERFAGNSARGFASYDFVLHDQSGRLVSLGAQRGSWVVVTFLYTRCPDVCPLIASQLNQVLRRLDPQARDRLRVLAVSVDPKGDTPAMVRWFIRKHRLLPQFRYLTGSRSELAPVWHAYHVAAQVGPPDVSLHSAYELLIDPRGRPRLLYTADLQARDLLHDLNALGVADQASPTHERRPS